MKKTFILLFSSLCTWSSAQVITFPDAAFKNVLLNTFCIDTNADGISDTDADTNNDNEIDVNEALAVTKLNLWQSNITDVTGIEHFINVTDINCNYNHITTLDVHQLSHLTVLSCGSNNLTSLNVQGLNHLQQLYCVINNLTSLDLHGLPNLVDLECKWNQLTSLNIQGDTSLSNIDCSDNHLTSLDFQGFTNLSHIDCSTNQLTGLDIQNLPLLEELICYENQIQTLTMQNLPALTMLICGTNNLSSIDVQNFPSLHGLSCSNNNIQALTIQGLNQLTELNCSGNQISNLSLTNLPNLTSFSCAYNNLSSIDLQGFPLLTTLDVSANHLTELNLSNNPILSSLSCTNNQLSILNIEQNPNILNANCHSNQLTELYIKNGTIANSLRLMHNPDLAFICCDSNELVNMQQSLDTLNLPNCIISSVCAYNPNGLPYTVYGNNRIDNNLNGCDSTDSAIPFCRFHLSTNNLSGTIFSNLAGDYATRLLAGQSTLTPILPNPNYFTISPPSVSMTFPGVTDTINQLFCTVPNGVHSDVEVILFPYSSISPGQETHFMIWYKNNGNQVENGTVSFTYDGSRLNLVSATHAPTQTSGQLTWTYSNLEPFQYRSERVVLIANTPLDTPAVNMGDVLLFFGDIQTGQVDENPSDNNFTLVQTVVSSFDPNDKTCLEGDGITPNQVGDYVHYLIRFENTGTAPAEKIVVKDTIDPNVFDLSSLQIIDASHDMYTKINHNNQVEFIFEGINLSFDDANNDGFVAFKIKTRPDLVLGDVLRNKASIYFDFNAPIVTNTAQTTVRLDAPSSTTNVTSKSAIHFYPNPVQTILHIASAERIEHVEVIDLNGRLIINTIYSNEGINIANLPNGTYIVKVYTASGISIEKVIIMKNA